MFGIIRPCRHRLSEKLHTTWMAHLCGLCLALRDGHGQLSRVATNYDGLVVSVLVDAQSERGGGQRAAGPCALRGMRGATVAHGEGARLAAAVSLVLASAKVRDHVEDGDGALGRRPVAAAARRVAGRWDRQGADTGRELGFDTALLVDAARRQAGVEALAGPGTSLLVVTEPTESATAAAFGHTAVLAGRPGNRAPLEEAGRLFGRLAHLLDAVEDLAEDRRTGAWNPLDATGTDLRRARELCADAVHGIRLALRDVEFADGDGRRLAHVLLAHEVEQSVRRVFGEPHGHGAACRSAAPSGGAGTEAGVPRAASGPSVSAPNPYGPLPQGPAGPPPGGGPYGPPPGGGPYGPGPNPYGPVPGGSGGPGGAGGGPGGGAPGGPGGPQRPPRWGRRRNWPAGCAVWSLMCCSCQLCCRDPYHDPWTGQPREGWCAKCDCCDCDCGCCDCDCCCDC